MTGSVAEVAQDDNAAHDHAAQDAGFAQGSVGASGLPTNYGRVARAGYLLTGITLLVALFSTPLLARGLGPEDFGIWSVALASVSYLEVLELGFGGATLALVSERAAKGDLRGVREAVATSFWLLSLPGLLALGLGALGAAFAPAILDLPADHVLPARLLILAFALDLALSIPGDTFGGVLGGFERLDLVALSLGAVMLAQGIGWVVVLALDGGLVALGLTTVGISVIGQASRYVLARRAAGPLPLSRRTVRRGLVTQMSKLSGWFAVSDLNRIVVQRVDVFIVAAIAGVVPAGIYAAGQKLALLVLRASEPLSATLFPHSARLRADGDLAALTRALLSSLRVTAAVSLPLAVATAWFARPLLDLWAGAAYRGATEVVVYLALGGIASALSGVAQQLLKGVGEVRRAGLVSILESVVNVTASIVLGLTHGAAGVALATLVSSALSATVALPAACRSVPGTPGRDTLTLLRAHLLAAVTASALAIGLLVATPAPGILVLPEVALVGLVHLFALSRLAMSPEERSLAAGWLRNRLSSRSGGSAVATGGVE